MDSWPERIVPRIGDPAAAALPPPYPVTLKNAPPGERSVASSLHERAGTRGGVCVCTGRDCHGCDQDWQRAKNQF